jgi:hypothetical protein
MARLRTSAVAFFVLFCGCSPAGSPVRGPRVEVLTQTEAGGTGLAVEPDRSVYWSTRVLNGVLGGSLWRLDLDGGEPVEIAAYGALHLALDRDYLYFASPEDGAYDRLGVGRVPVTGGEPEWYYLNGADGSALTLALDRDWVYWLLGGRMRGLFRAPRDGTGTISAGGVLEGAESTKLGELEDVWGELVLAGDYLYFITLDSIGRMPKGGGAPQTVLSEEQWSCCFLAAPTRLAVAGEHLYWTSGEVASGGLGRVRVDGGDMQELFTDHSEGLDNGLVALSALAVDDTHVYWSRGRANTVAADEGDQEILRMPLAGGEPQVVARGQNGVAAIEVTDEYVYWITSVAKRVTRVRKQDLQ